jgi:hypothetical protein
VDEALRAGGFWEEVLDSNLAARAWETAPDDLVLLHLLPSVIGSESLTRA